MQRHLVNTHIVFFQTIKLPTGFNTTKKWDFCDIILLAPNYLQNNCHCNKFVYTTNYNLLVQSYKYKRPFEVPELNYFYCFIV